ncbi:Uncharacterized protein APZ42_012324 [Daphnia magna]|uniref:Uncharacterized protein n=1 Tax=Daphnia magna TaxID=35525 RepID=A0A162RYD8_9CRUS|nr:Uncharacterized protein APZ42_012324 [Daphnia magna]
MPHKRRTNFTSRESHQSTSDAVIFLNLFEAFIRYFLFTESQQSRFFGKKKRIFPRLEEVKRFYICTKAQGVSRNLTIKHYSTPSAPVLKRLSGKLVVLVPLKASLPYESLDEGVDCDVCQQTVPIRQLAHHIDRCTEQAFRTTKRKTY